MNCSPFRFFSKIFRDSIPRSNLSKILLYRVRISELFATHTTLAVSLLTLSLRPTTVWLILFGPIQNWSCSFFLCSTIELASPETSYAGSNNLPHRTQSLFSVTIGFCWHFSESAQYVRGVDDYGSGGFTVFFSLSQTPSSSDLMMVSCACHVIQKPRKHLSFLFCLTDHSRASSPGECPPLPNVV